MIAKEMFKRILITAGFILTAAFNCFSASTGTITLSVTVYPVLQIDVWYLNTAVSSYDFGTLGVSETSITVSSITVENSSDGLTEDWYIRATDAKGVGTSWTLADAIGTNQYKLEALLSGNDQPVSGSFDGNDLTTTSQAMTSLKFADGENGENVSSNSTRGLWFRINTPSEVSSTSQKTIWVTIIASQGG